MKSFLTSAVLLPGVSAAAQNILYSPNNYRFNALEHMAGIAPYFDPEDPQLDPAPPQGCNVTRAAYLIRHAAIYANDFDYETYIEPFTDKLANTSVDWSVSSDLSFLSTWKSPIEDDDVEELAKIGVLEAMSLGVELARRYSSFSAPNKVWTSTAERTVKSAQSFINGFDRESNMSTLVQISEGSEEGADSLTPYEACPAYSSSRGSSQSSAFMDKYTGPILARFRAAVPGFNWTADDIYGMQQLCGYEAVIRGDSPFCSTTLFTPDEWLAFEYTNDIMYFHNTGYANPISPVIGFPWANASVHALMSDADDAQDIYVSFTHRELPPTVLVALGLFNNSAFTGVDNPNATMPTDRINHRRAWRSSHMLSFLTNIAIEKMSCDSYGFESNGSSDEYYRVLVNDSPQPLYGCDDGPGESCARDTFESWLAERGELFGDFSTKCGVDYDNSTDVLTIYNS